MKTTITLLIILCLSLTVQAQVSKSVNVATAGTLYTLLTQTEKETVTRLTVTGSLDASDFNVLMSVYYLADLDLSRVSIVAYTGGAGPLSSTNFYPSNELPKGTFYSQYGYSNTTLKSVILPISLKSIGGSAFNSCESLTSISIPAGVTSIAYGSLGAKFTEINVENGNQNYSGLNGVLFDKNITTLIRYPRAKIGSSYSIPLSVTSIVENAFASSANLTNMSIPNSITSIGHDAFTDCSNLTNLTIPSSITSIGAWSFSYCTKLSSIYVYGTIPLDLSLSYFLFYDVVKTTCTLYVPFGSKALYQNANQWKDFVNIVEFDSQTSKTINVTQAGTLSNLLNANELISISKLTITGNIDATDFKTLRDNMPMLQILDLSGVNITAYTGTAGTYSTDIIVYPEKQIPAKAFLKIADVSTQNLISVVLPLSTNSIGNNAFYNCTGLSSLIIPSSVTSILYFAFSGCSGLTNMTIPASVTSIGNGTFSNCMKLTTINVESGNNNYCDMDGVLFSKNKSTLMQYPSGKKSENYSIPSSVISVSVSAFYGCSGLTNISIPTSVMSINNSAFNNCTGLKSIYVYPPTPVDLSATNSVFYNVNTSTCTLYVPIGSKALYKSAVQWKDFVNIVEFDPTSIKNLSVLTLGIYPSAFSDGFRIKGISDVALLTIYDLKGRLLLTKTITGNEYVSASGLSKGTYIAKVQVGRNTSNHKIVKL